MPMPDALTDFLMQHRDAIWTTLCNAVWGAVGAYITVLLNLLDPVEKGRMNALEIWATMFIGTVFAMAMSSVLGLFVGIPAMVSAPIGASALLTGMLGRKMAQRILRVKFNLPKEE